MQKIWILSLKDNVQCSMNTTIRFKSQQIYNSASTQLYNLALKAAYSRQCTLSYLYKNMSSILHNSTTLLKYFTPYKSWNLSTTHRTLSRLTDHFIFYIAISNLTPIWLNKLPTSTYSTTKQQLKNKHYYPKDYLFACHKIWILRIYVTT